MSERAPWPPAAPPDDEIDPLAVDVAHALLRLRLRMASPEGVSLLIRFEWGDLVANAIATPEAAYQVICAIARTGGVMLRPQGWDGGPLGAGVVAPTIGTLLADLTAGSNAARLIGAGARGDSDMVRALALAVVNNPDPGPALAVLRAMLEISAREPQDPKPEGMTP